MFTQLASLLKNCNSVNLILAANKDGTLSVTVLPKSKDASADAAALSTPLCLTATADELDAEFADILGKYVGIHQSLAEQMENTNAILEAAKQESQKKATTAISKSTTKSKGTEAAPSESDSGDDDNEDENAGESSDGAKSEDTGTSQENSTKATVSDSSDNLWG